MILLSNRLTTGMYSCAKRLLSTNHTLLCRLRRPNPLNHVLQIGQRHQMLQLALAQPILAWREQPIHGQCRTCQLGRVEHA